MIKTRTLGWAPHPVGIPPLSDEERATPIGTIVDEVETIGGCDLYKALTRADLYPINTEHDGSDAGFLSRVRIHLKSCPIMHLLSHLKKKRIDL